MGTMGWDGGIMVNFLLVMRAFWSRRGSRNWLKSRREMMRLQGDIGGKKRRV